MLAAHLLQLHCGVAGHVLQHPASYCPTIRAYLHSLGARLPPRRDSLRESAPQNENRCATYSMMITPSA